jgi:DNA-binding transcriptional LysR family regulator
MNTARPDLNLLVVFDAVASTGSVTLAAGKLSLSQPAVSHALNRLRDVVDDPLFVRAGNRLTPTPHATRMIPQVRALLDSAGPLLVSAKFDPATSTQTFKVGASDYAMMTVLPGVVRAMRAQAPGTTLDIRPIGEASQAQLAAGELDVAFWGASPPPPPFSSQELFREHFIGLICARHVLAVRAGQGKLTLEDYLRYPHVMVTFRDPRKSPIDAGLEELGKVRRIAVSTPNFASNVASVQSTDLIMSLPARLAGSADQSDLVAFKLPLDIPDYPYSIIWHRRSDGDPAMMWLRNLVASLR